MIGLPFVIKKRSHSSITYFFFPVSSAQYLMSNLSQMILADLKVTNKLNRGLVIWFNRYPLTVLLYVSNFFVVSSSIVLQLSLTGPSLEATVISQVLFFSVRQRKIHSQPLIIQRIWAVFETNIYNWFHLKVLILGGQEEFCGLLEP